MHVELMRDSSTMNSVEDIDSMKVWYCKYKDFSAIKQFVNLRELVVGGYPGRTFDSFEGLARLRYLAVVHLPNVSELNALSSLLSLESISLSTSPLASRNIRTRLWSGSIGRRE